MITNFKPYPMILLIKNRIKGNSAMHQTEGYKQPAVLVILKSNEQFLLLKRKNHQMKESIHLLVENSIPLNHLTKPPFGRPTKKPELKLPI